MHTPRLPLKKTLLALTVTAALVSGSGVAAHATTVTSGDGNEILTYHYSRSGSGLIFFGTIRTVSISGANSWPSVGERVVLDDSAIPSGSYDIMTLKTDSKGACKFPIVHSSLASEFTLIAESGNFYSPPIKIPKLVRAATRMVAATSADGSPSKRSGSTVDVYGSFEFKHDWYKKTTHWASVVDHTYVHLQRRVGSAWKNVKTIKAGLTASPTWQTTHYRGTFVHRTSFRWVFNGSSDYAKSTSASFTL